MLQPRDAIRAALPLFELVDQRRSHIADNAVIDRVGPPRIDRELAPSMAISHILKRRSRHSHATSGSNADFVSARSPYFSPFSRREPSRSGCHPNTSVTMKPSMRSASGAVSFSVDL